MEEELVPLKAGFDVSLRGFDRTQVTQFLRETQEEIRVLSTDRDSAVAQSDALSKQLQGAHRELESLRRKVDDLSKAPMSAADLGDRLDRMIALSNKEAEEITARAQANAANIGVNAEQDAKALRERYQSMLSELDVLRDELSAEHDKTMTEAHSKIAKLERESQARRTKAEKEHTESVANREASFSKEHGERQESSKRDATARIRIATTDAENRVREAKEQADKSLKAAKAEADAQVQAATTQAGQHLDEAHTTAQKMIDDAMAKVSSLRQLRAKVATQLETALALLRQAEPNLSKLADEDDTVRVNSLPVTGQRDEAESDKESAAASQEKTRELPKPRSAAATQRS